MIKSYYQTSAQHAIGVVELIHVTLKANRSPVVARSQLCE